MTRAVYVTRSFDGNDEADAAEQALFVHRSQFFRSPAAAIAGCQAQASELWGEVYDRVGPCPQLEWAVTSPVLGVMTASLDLDDAHSLEWSVTRINL